VNQEEAQTRMKELEQQIAELPVGSITRKTVNGKIYHYQTYANRYDARLGMHQSIYTQAIYGTGSIYVFRGTL